MKERSAPIVGPDVADQTQIRPSRPLRSLDEFIAFLIQIEDLFGPCEQDRAPTTGDYFEL